MIIFIYDYTIIYSGKKYVNLMLICIELPKMCLFSVNIT